MAVNIDTVYQRVLAIANKEQRGYVTPQEFNLLANQAQLQIFEQYFYEAGRRSRTDADKVPNTEQMNSRGDVKALLDEKLDVFKTVSTVTSGHTFPSNYTVGKVWANGYEAQKVPFNDLKRVAASSRHVSGPTTEPIYCESNTNGQDIIVLNGSSTPATTAVSCEVFNKPAAAEWDYVVVASKALYNAAGSTNFSLHESEETELVNVILELAGIVINKPGLVQLAAQREANAKAMQDK